jgi:tetratricopeptide (TPR) repeat protein
MRMGEIEIAKEYAGEAIIRDEKNIWYYLHLAAIHQMQRNIDSTIIVYEKILELDENNVEYIYNMALLYKEAGDYDKALKTIKKIENALGVNERIIYLKHDLYDRLKRKKEAIKVLKEGIIYFPENINMYGLLAEYYAEIGEFDEADNIYQEILKKDSVNNKVILSYADYLTGIDSIDKAFDYYQRAIEDKEMPFSDKIMIIASLINDRRIIEGSHKHTGDLIERMKDGYPENIEVRLLKIDFNIRMNRYDEASEDLKYVVDKRPDNINAWKQLLYLENYMSHYDSVIYYAESAIEIFEKEATFYIMEGLAWLQKGESEKAINILLQGDKYAATNEEKIQIYGYLAELYRNTGEDLISDDYFEKALKLDQYNVLIRNNYSYYLALRGKALKKAERLSKYTIEMEPSNATYLDTYAWILYKMGKYKNALKYIERAVRFDGGNNSEIMDHYGDILMRLSKYEKAIEMWQKVLEIDDDNQIIKDKIDQAGKSMKNSK